MNCIKKSKNLAIVNRFLSNCKKPPTNVKTKSKFVFLKLTTAAIGGALSFDGIANNFVYTKAAGRFVRSLKVAGLISMDYFLILRKADEENYEEKLKLVHLASANKILEACMLNGGLYIKVGQSVAAINHILPEEYTKTLSQLQDKCLPQNQTDVQQVFRKEFGKLPEEIYEEFDYTPIAAASLAQVFKAKLKTGEKVAVKVQYSDLETRFPSDLGTISFLQDVIEIFFKNYNFGWILKDLRKNLEKELDFNNEGKSAEQCGRDLKKFNFVHVPTVNWDYTCKRILTMEWIDGCKITDLEQLKSQNIKLIDLDVKLFEIFSEQIFNTGFVHADPHPGNIFVRVKKSGEPELVLLDHGLYDSLTDHARLCLCEFWEATVLKDERKMQDSALKLHINAYKHFAEVLFQTPYETNVTIKSKLTVEDIEYMQKIAKENFQQIMNTLKEMPRNMLFVIRNLNIIRAISREHGDPVDRPKFMARYAQKCIYNRQNSIFGYFKWLYRRIRFEYCFIKKSIQWSLIGLYIDVLHKLGRSPEDSKNLFIHQKTM